MENFWLKVIYEALRRLLGSGAWQEIVKNVNAAESMPGFDGTAKKRYVLERLKWMVEDLRKGFRSQVLQLITHILVAVAIDMAAAQLKIERQS